MKKQLKNKKRKGFTLVELMIAMVIVGILALAALIGGAEYINSSREEATRSDFDSFNTAFEMMMFENNPLSTQDLPSTENLIVKLNAYLPVELEITGSAETDIFSKKLDPWGKPYQLVINNDKANTEFKIYVISYGKDSVTKTAGTTLDKTDLMSVIELQSGQIATLNIGFNEENNVDSPVDTILDYEAIAD